MTDSLTAEDKRYAEMFDTTKQDANKGLDLKIYERPDEYDIHRRKHHHMGLGLGPHRCLGMDVAKQEMVAAINGLMDRWPNLRLDPDKPAPRFVGLDHCGMSAVTVRLDK
jgi:cytochrome P450